MFSATGKILPGSIDRPSIVTLLQGMNTVGDVSAWNKVGYIPVISTITGCARALLGVIHSIVHLASAIFDPKNRDQHLQEAKLGGYNIGRGLVEMIPVIGNIILFVKDVIAIVKCSHLALTYMLENGHDPDSMILFVDGKKVGQKSLNELSEIKQGLGFKKQTSILETAKLIQMRV